MSAGPLPLFLSCVSREFGSHRLRLANQLGALKGNLYDVRVQEDFRQGGHTLLDRLTDYIRDCDLVIHLVGGACGSRPSPEHAQTALRHFDQAAPDPSDWSYTQWEYRLAVHFGKRVLTYIAKADARRDCALPIAQSDDEARGQQAHLAAIRDSGKHWKYFSAHHDLIREVFYDLGLEPNLKINNLPYKSLGSLFKGREDSLGQIREALGDVGHAGHQRFAAIRATATAVAVHGLGGIGKTRTAIEFAHRHAEDYTALLFVPADSPASLRQNFAALCGSLVFDLPEKDAREVEIQEAAVLRWLKQHPGWFLILDGVDTEDAAAAVVGLLGQLQSAGQALVTSRLTGWPGAVKTLALDVLSKDAATQFLLERTDRPQGRRKTSEDEPEAGTLAEELGLLALALEQAGAYIAHRRMTLAGYRTEWRVHHDKVIEWFDERLMAYPKSVAVTWQTSFDQLTGPARQLLRRLAWLAPEPIPEWLLDVPMPEAIVHGNIDPLDALANLETYSLIFRSVDAPVFSVHRLVQDVTRRTQRGGSDQSSLAETLHWLNAAFEGDPGNVRSWPILNPLAEHVDTVAQTADAAGITDPTARLLNQLGLLRATKGLWHEAEPMYRRALAIDEQTYGVHHPNVAKHLGNLAALLQATDRFTEAEQLTRRVLAIFEQSFGPNHADVGTTLSNLAALLHTTNRLAEAEPLMHRALAIHEASYGPKHPKVASDLNNLATLLADTNRFAEAESMFGRALAIDMSTYGPDDPKVALDLNNMAQLFQNTGRLELAEEVMRRVVKIYEQSFGSTHPNVATALNNLAQLLKPTERLAEAEPLMRRALAIEEQNYGPNHSSVARSLNNLAQLFKATGRLTEAEPLLRRCITIFEQNLSQAHPKVATALNNLAQLLQTTKRLAEAELLMRRALAIDEKAYGSDHPNVAIHVINLSQLLYSTRQFAEAEPFMRRALAIDEQTYGPDNPKVAIRLNNLAQLLQATKRLDEAESLMRRALTIDEQTHGPDNPKVAIHLSNLAQLLQNTKRPAEAEPLMRRALAIDEKTLGPEHINVGIRLNNLAHLLHATKQLVEAEPLMRQALAIFVSNLGTHDKNTVTVFNNYASLLRETGKTDVDIRESIEALMRPNK